VGVENRVVKPLERDQRARLSLNVGSGTGLRHTGSVCRTHSEVAFHTLGAVSLTYLTCIRGT